MAHGAWRMAHGAWRMAHGAWRYYSKHSKYGIATCGASRRGLFIPSLSSQNSTTYFSHDKSPEAWQFGLPDSPLTGFLYMRTGLRLARGGVM
jgi:hypothetical protein